MAARTFYLVIFDQEKSKGVINAMPSIISEEDAKILLQEALPMIERKKEGKKFQVVEKRMFEYKNLDGSITLMIICDCNRLKYYREQQLKK